MLKYLNNIKIDHFLSKDEEIECFNSKIKSEKDKLIISNIPLAKKFAQKYMKKTPILTDEILEASLFGLCVALNNWDPTKGRFNSYCTFWMKKYVIEFLRNNYETKNKEVSLEMVMKKYETRNFK